MKKLLVATLMSAMMLSLVACGAETTTTNEDTTVETTEETTSENEAEEAEEVEETEETEEESEEAEETEETEEESEEAEEKVITVIISNNTTDGEDEIYEVNTSAEFLLDALTDSEDITVGGTEEDWGFYLTTVNGLEANYDEDGAYWAIYVNGEYGEYGVDTQPIEDGDEFTLCYDVYTEE